MICPLWEIECSEVSQYCEFWRVSGYTTDMPRKGEMGRILPNWQCCIGLDILERIEK